MEQYLKVEGESKKDFFFNLRTRVIAPKSRRKGLMRRRILFKKKKRKKVVLEKQDAEKVWKKNQN